MTVRPFQYMLITLCAGAAFVLAGCGKGEVEALSAAKVRIEKGTDSAVEIDLKNLLQRFPQSGEARFLLGRQIQKRGGDAAAMIEFQRALDLKYADSLVVPAMARSLLTQGKFKQVVDEFGKTSLTDAMATAELQALVAQAMALDGDTQAANVLIDRAAAGAPASEPVLLTKASFLAQAGNSDQAIAVLDALIAKKPDSHLAWTMKGNVQGVNPATLDAARQSFRKAVGINGKEVTPRTGLIALSLQKGDIDGAQIELEQLKKIAPKQITTQFYEASLAYAKGRYTDAQSRYQAILRVLPLHPLVLLAAAENELKLNATAQAETLVAKVLAQAPDNLRARQLQAQVYLRMGQPAKAIASLSSLIDSPRVTPQILALAAQAQLLNGNPAAANQLFNQMAKLKPRAPQLRTMIATAALGHKSDESVYNELRSIAEEDSGTTADIALVSTYMLRGLPNDALKALDAADRKRPNDPNQKILRGQILVNKSDLPGARHAFEQTLAVSPGHLKAVLALASLDLRAGMPGAAKERIQALLTLQPKNARAMLALAELLATDPSQTAQRRKLLESAVQFDPLDAEARAALVTLHWDSGDGKSALAAAQAASAALPQSVEMLELLAWCQLRLGEKSQALSIYRKIVTLAPSNPRGHVGTTEIHLQNGDLDNARRSIERGLQAAQGNPEILAQAIALQLRQRQPEQARSIARSVQKDRPRDAIGWILEAEIDASQQHWAAAASSYRKALDKSPPMGLLPKYLHVLKLDGRAAEARAYADDHLKANPNDFELLFYMADAAQRDGDLKLARRLYEDLLQRKGDHLLALNNLATVYLAQKQPGALPLARRAALLAPRQPAVLDTLAEALAAEGRLVEAVTTQRQAVQQAPNLPEFRLTLAKLLITNGDRAEAKQELARLAGLGLGFPKQAEVGELLSSLGRTPAVR